MDKGSGQPFHSSISPNALAAWTGVAFEYRFPVARAQRAERCRRLTYTPAVAGTLYVVATPIGNLEDLTARAARVLADADLIAAENTRTASKLLRRLHPRGRCVPYNDRNKARSTPALLAALADGRAVALMSDAGTPGLSDPGQDLVAAALRAGAQVIPVPGPSALTALLSVAGVRARTVRFLGFLPRRAGERRRLLAEVTERGEPVIAFESPRRLRDTLAAIDRATPKAHLVIGRELTKRHEEIWRGSAAEALVRFERPLGEFTLLIAPPAPQPATWPDAEVIEALRREREDGRRRSQAAAAVAARSGWSRRAVYALWPDADPPAC